MTDAEKLREIAGLSGALQARDAANLLRIASLLDAVPPETLRGLKEDTMVAIPTLALLELTRACSPQRPRNRRGER